jgi:hypothetical protein
MWSVGTRAELSARSSHAVVRSATDGVLYAAADPRLEGESIGV